MSSLILASTAAGTGVSCEQCDETFKVNKMREFLAWLIYILLSGEDAVKLDIM